MKYDQLLQEAWNVRDRAYCPYSSFAVGAALLTEEGLIFTGCNVENKSFGMTICAERVATSSAVAAGYRSFIALAVVADTSFPVSPCGACRQFLCEFGDFIVLLGNRTDLKQFTVSDLLPRANLGILNHTN